MNNYFSDVWIGCLPIGRELDLIQTKNLLTSLPECHSYILDLSDIYSNGEAVSIISELCESLPINISFSLKLGLISSVREDRFTVDARSWHVDELYECFRSYADLLDSSRIHSFQLHALPNDPQSVAHCIDSLKMIKRDFSVELGISNIEIKQFLEIHKQFSSFDFVQLHANVIEQRLLHEFSSVNIELHPKYFILNRIFCRGLLNDLNYIFNNPTSRFNVSDRVKSSLTDERLIILHDVHRLCQEYSVSIQELALGFCFTFNISLKPILGGKNINQILHSISILDNLDSSRMDLITCICQTLFSLHSDSILISPLVAFER